MLKSVQTENPNNFFTEKVSPSIDVNNSVRTNTKEMARPRTAKMKIIIPLTTKNKENTFRSLIIKKTFTKLNIEKVNKFEYEES